MKFSGKVRGHPAPLAGRRVYLDPACSTVWTTSRKRSRLIGLVRYSLTPAAFMRSIWSEVVAWR